jgi:hypothetical protein
LSVVPLKINSCPPEFLLENKPIAKIRVRLDYLSSLLNQVKESIEDDEDVVWAQDRLVDLSKEALFLRDSLKQSTKEAEHE